MNYELVELIERSETTIHLLNNGKHLAQATIDIGGLGWEIRNFLIGGDKDKPWVMPPNWRGRGDGSKTNYHTYIQDEKAWFLLTQKIIEAFKNHLNEEFNNQDVEEILGSY